MLTATTCSCETWHAVPAVKAKRAKAAAAVLPVSVVTNTAIHLTGFSRLGLGTPLEIRQALVTGALTEEGLELVLNVSSLSRYSCCDTVHVVVREPRCHSGVIRPDLEWASLLQALYIVTGESRLPCMFQLIVLALHQSSG